MSVYNNIFNNLSGKILISSPYMLEGIFNKSLIYILSHNQEGSMGLIFNHFINCINIKSFFQISDNIVSDNIIMPIYFGGPIEHEKGFFLHSDDYSENLLLKFHNNLAISSNSKISHDIALGHGPKKSLFIVGYTSWKGGQLENELKDNLWLILESDYDFIFSEHPESKWQKALEIIGVKKSCFISCIGSA